MSESKQASMTLLVPRQYEGNPDLVVLVDIGNDTAWVTQKQIAELLDVKVNTVNEAVKRIKKERGDGWDAVIRKLRITATDGKVYEVEHYDMTVVNLIGSRAQHSEAVTAFQDWVGRQLNHAVVKQIVKTTRDITREDGKISRLAFMQAIRDALNPPQWFYGQATNEVYKGVFHRDHKTLCKELQTTSPRNKMDTIALRYLDIAETICARRIGDALELTIPQAREIIQLVSGMIGFQVDDIERQFGIDAVTGRKLLTSIDAIRGIEAAA